MIKFECPKCAHEIIASDKEAGGQKKCPNCFSYQKVPYPEYVVARKRARSKKRPNYGIRAGSKSKKPGKLRFLKYLHEEPEEDEGNDIISLKFTESKLFTMCLAFLLIYFFDLTMRLEVHTFLSRLCGTNATVTFLSTVFLLLPFSVGFLLSIFHAFSKREKSWGEKAAMLFFAVFITTATGIYSGWYIFKNSQHYLMFLFALWNFSYGVLLVLKFENIIIWRNDLDGNYVSDRDATFPQIAFNSAVIITLLLCCKYWFGLHWIISYSIYIAYTTTLDKAAKMVFNL